MKITVLSLLTMMCCISCATRISPEQAKEVAEQFIVKQGYTATLADRNVVQGESFQLPGRSIEFISNARLDSLYPTASGVLSGRHPSFKSPGWTIAFKRKNHFYAGSLSVVTMNSLGDDVLMQHSGLPIFEFKRLKAEQDAAANPYPLRSWGCADPPIAVDHQ